MDSLPDTLDFERPEKAEPDVAGAALSEQGIGNVFSIAPTYLFIGWSLFLGAAVIVFFVLKSRNPQPDTDAKQKRQKGGKTTIPLTARGKESNCVLFVRFVENGVNDDAVFGPLQKLPDKTRQHVLDLLSVNPLQPQQKRGLDRLVNQTLESKVAFCIGCDGGRPAANPTSSSSSTTINWNHLYAHEDAERVSGLLESLGYKSILLSDKSGQAPSSTLLAQWALNLKHCDRNWESVVIYVAGRTRLVEIDRTALMAMSKNLAEDGDAVPAAAESAEVPSSPAYFVELLVDSAAPENPKSWVDLHMMVQRFVDAVKGQGTCEVSVMLDIAFDTNTDVLLLQSDGEALSKTKEWLRARSFQALIEEIFVLRRIQAHVLGAQRVVAPPSGTAKKPKYLGSLLTRRICSDAAAAMKSGGAQESQSIPGLDHQSTEYQALVETEDSDATSGAVKFPTASDFSPQLTYYHCGRVTLESLFAYLQLSTADASATQEGAASSSIQGGTAGWTFLFSTTLGAFPPLAFQESLQPRIVGRLALDAHHRPAAPQQPATEESPLFLNLFKLLYYPIPSEQNADLGPSRVVLIKATSGTGLSTLLKRFCWYQEVIRREVVYVDLDDYQAPRVSVSGEDAVAFPFISLVSDLGRILCNLEHPLPNEAEAADFASNVLSRLKVTIILDNFNRSRETEGFLKWFATVISGRTSPAEEKHAKKTFLRLALGVTYLPQERNSSGKEPLLGVERHATSAKPLIFDCRELSPTPNALLLPTDILAFLRFPSAGFDASAFIEPDEDSVKTLKQDPAMTFWHWELVRGLLRCAECEVPESANEVLVNTAAALSADEQKLVAHFLEMSRSDVRDTLLFEHLSTVALGIQCGFSSPWDLLSSLKKLKNLGVLQMYFALEPCSAKEGKLLSARLNPVFARHLLAKKVESAASIGAINSTLELCNRIVKAYATRVSNAVQLRFLGDGFYLPRLLTTLAVLTRSRRGAVADAKNVTNPQEVFPAPKYMSVEGNECLSTLSAYRFLEESFKSRGVMATLRCYKQIASLLQQQMVSSATKDGASQGAEEAHAILQLPPQVVKTLLENETALVYQPNELLQLALSSAMSVNASGESAKHFNPIKRRFYSNVLSSKKDSVPFVPSNVRGDATNGARVVCLRLLDLNVFPDTNDYVTSAFVEPKQSKGKGDSSSGKSISSVVLGFRSGRVGILSIIGFSTTDQALTAILSSSSTSPSGYGTLELREVTTTKRHSAPVDHILPYGSTGKWVTASKTIHEIFLWEADWSSCKQFEQLPRPPPSGRSGDSTDEDEEDEEGNETKSFEDDDEESEAMNFKRTILAHRVGRRMGQFHYNAYVRSFGEPEPQGLHPMQDGATIASPPSETQTVLLAVVRDRGPHSAPSLFETTAKDCLVFNSIVTQGLDVYRGIATYSTPSDAVNVTTALMLNDQEGNAMVLVAMDNGVIELCGLFVYGLKKVMQ